MTVDWLTFEIDQFAQSCGYAPVYVEVDSASASAIYSDINWPLHMHPLPPNPVFYVSSIPVNARADLFPGAGIFYGVGGYAYHSLYKKAGDVPVIEKPTCDCGAVKCNQPGHSAWCATQQVSA